MSVRGTTSVAVAGLMAAWSVQAGAQATSTAQPTAPVANQAEARPDDGSLADIVVTAERRSTNLQDTPLAITAFTGDALSNAGVTAVSGLTDAVPALKFNAAPDYPQIYLRGVGNNDLSTNGSPGVALAIDGVFLARPTFGDGGFYDVERVEVLRGPQGTLYGRNAIGGVINVISRRPGYQFGGDARVEVGNYDLLRASGALNVPLIDGKLALRGAFQASRRDGYYSNGLADADDVAARLRLLFEPTDRLSVLLTADYLKSSPRGTFQRNAPFTGDPWDVGNFDGSDAFNRIERKTFNAEVTLDLDFADLTYLGAYSRQDQDLVLEFQDLSRPLPAPGACPNSPLCSGDYRQEDDAASRQWTHEVRLSNDAGPLKWVVGGFYLKDRRRSFSRQLEGRLDDPANPPQIGGFAYPRYVTESIAAFGQATYSVLDTLRVTGGIRYTKDRKEQTVRRIAGGPALESANSWDAVNYRIGIDYDLGPASLLYANVTTGFKAGGFFVANLPPDNVFDPENVRAYAIGSKNRFLDNRLQLNAEAFYYDYSDYQATTFGVGTSGSFGTVVRNAGEATLYGFELEGDFRATANDRITASVGYLHSNYDDFQIPYGLNFLVPCRFFPDCQTNAASPTGFSLVYTGRDLPFSPKWSISGGYERTFRLTGDRAIVAAVQSSFSSPYFLGYETTDPESLRRQDSYTRTNASLTYYGPDRRYSVGAWVRNIERTAVGDLLLFNPSLGYQLGIQAPRTYGATATARF